MSNLKHLKEMMDSKLPSKEWHEKYNEGMKAKSKALKGAKKESIIERSNRQVAERNAGKTKEQISNDAFKSGRTSGRY